jgi:hypothetical protein
VPRDQDHDELNERLIDIRSGTVRKELDFSEGQRVALVFPAGMVPDALRAAEIRFGPLSTMVLGGLREVGLAARRMEIEDLQARVRRDAFGLTDANEFEPGREPDPSPVTSILAWRTIAAFSQSVEELAALLAALDAWHAAGRPSHLECLIGRDFLRWRSDSELAIPDVLRRHASVDAIKRILMYLNEDDLRRIGLSDEDVALIAELCDRTAQLVAHNLTLMSELMTQAANRTFVRWKHRLSAIVPALVPVWLPAEELDREAMDRAFSSGFGLIDWGPRKTDQPEMILWNAGRKQFVFYGSLTDSALSLMTLLIDATMRWSVGGAEPIPWWTTVGFPIPEQMTDALTRIDRRRHYERGIVKFFSGLDIDSTNEDPVGA